MAKLPLSYSHQNRKPRALRVLKRSSSDKIKSIPELKEKFSTKKNIVVISGAGISTNAGGQYSPSMSAWIRTHLVAVRDFYSCSKTNYNRHVFDASAFLIPERESEMNDWILTILRSASKSSLTKFHHLLESLAQSGRLLRHYTQNFDCLSDRLPSLSKRTIMIHGRGDTLRCHKRSSHTVRITAETFSELVQSECPTCAEEQKEGKMRRCRTGKLRTDVVLYNEPNPYDSDIFDAVDDDLCKPIDAVIIVGTRLLIADLRNFVEDFCKGVPGRECLTIWVNTTHMAPGLDVDYEYIGDCDEFASLFLE
jgi:NAD-dependent SIR2 family protein deacetylase